MIDPSARGLDSDIQRLEYVRPLYLAIGLSLAAELLLWLVWGLMLFPKGPPSVKLIWALTCGLGMGAFIGALTLLIGVLEGLAGLKGFIVSALIAFFIFAGCNILCFHLDQHYQFWGTDTRPGLFLTNGIILSIVGSLLYGSLLFTQRGHILFRRVGL